MHGDSHLNTNTAASQGAQAAGNQHQPNNPLVLALAGALSLSPQEVRTQNRAGQTLRQIASTQGLDFGDVQNALVTAAKSAVSSGQLSERQAQSLLSLVADPSFGSTVESTHQLLRAMHSPEMG